MNTDPDATIPSKLEYDKEFSIAVAQSRMSAKWINKSMSVLEFAGKLGTTARTQETFDEYLTMSKGDQDTIKDVGGYVGAMLKGGRRTKASVANRQILTFDIDYGKPETVERVKKALAAYCYTISSTHKHSEAKPRFRVVGYTDRVMTVEEYQAVARKVAEKIDIEVFDTGSYDVNRLLFWPSTSSDGKFLFYHNDQPFIPVDKMLNGYGEKDAWKDTSLWPRSSRETKRFDRILKHQADPLTKKGIIGAFCRVVSIEQALKDRLGDVYKKESADRYTYIDGSSSKGLVVYDGKFAYSNHDSDPCCGQLCNAFDLVRIHKFGHLDDETSPNTSTVKLPSYTQMIEWAQDVKGVKADLVRSGQAIDESSFDVFNTGNEAPDEDNEWAGELQFTAKGELKSSLHNAMTIVQNNPRLKDAMRFNEFSQILERSDGSQWIEKDSLNLHKYIGAHYGPDFSSQKIMNAIYQRGYENSHHPVRDYLWGLRWDGVSRLEPLFIDYFGCPDNVYTREAALCWFAAAVYRVMEPGYKFDFAPVISGEQGVGKTTFLRVMGYEKWYGELSSFDPKIAIEEISGKWLVEINEMGATNKQALEAQKSFLSACYTRTRLAYRRDAENYGRQCVFMGTTNQDEYLKDSTGNRRWWPIEVSVEAIDIEKLKVERDQIWAEALVLWCGGYETFLTPEAEVLAREAQEAKLEEDEWKGKIEAWLEQEAYRDRYLSKLGSRGGPLGQRDRVCFAEIWEDCLEQEGKAWSSDKGRVRHIMKKIEGWKKSDGTWFGNRFGHQRGWVTVR